MQKIKKKKISQKFKKYSQNYKQDIPLFYFTTYITYYFTKSVIFIQ